MSAVPSAFMRVLVEVEDLVMPEGVVIVLDLLIVPELLLIVDDLLMPAGFVIVLDFVVVRVAGACEALVVIFDELLLIQVFVEAGGMAAGVWVRAKVPPNRLRKRRKPKMRSMTRNKRRQKHVLLTQQ